MAGDTVTIFCDKDGKELYTKTNTCLCDVYKFNASDGGYVTYTDADRDGNIDTMTYLDENNNSLYQAFDNNDEGTFDTAMRNSGKEIGHEFNLRQDYITQVFSSIFGTDDEQI